MIVLTKKRKNTIEKLRQQFDNVFHHGYAKHNLLDEYSLAYPFKHVNVKIDQKTNKKFVKERIGVKL